MVYSKQSLHRLRRILGRNIHELRTRREIPLGKLARLSELPEFLLDRYEIGKGAIDLHHMLRIACALGADVGNLLRHEDLGKS